MKIECCNKFNIVISYGYTFFTYTHKKIVNGVKSVLPN